jgi:succinate dehydrogenase/fumarate reductase iron-sulfur protein
MKTATVKVLKYDPTLDEEARLQEYLVPFQDGMRVSDALQYIYEEIDHSLAFRCSCRISNCQICLMKANGKTIYACQERLSDEMILEPLPGFDVVRDLVVDFDGDKEDTAKGDNI